MARSSTSRSVNGCTQVRDAFRKRNGSELTISPDEHGSLPAHPQYGRIVEITPSESAREIECFAYPYVETESAAFRVQGDSTVKNEIKTEGAPVRFEFADGLISFVTPTSQWFLDGQQIESYECR